jgi:hypothetical protein
VTPRKPKKIRDEDVIAVYRGRAAAMAAIPERLEVPELAPADIEAIYLQRARRYLRKIGWVKSALFGAPVDREENPIPWYTYACTSFLAKRVKPEFRVFEYGSGHSTLWWSQRVAHVTAVEHNVDWYEHVKASMPPNVNYVFNPADYTGELLKHSPQFDVVVIDGLDRVECSKMAPRGLRERGVIIWDNANRDSYQEGYDFLASHGFRRIDFDSTGPIWVSAWTTTVFYREGNCLGI